MLLCAYICTQKFQFFRISCIPEISIFTDLCWSFYAIRVPYACCFCWRSCLHLFSCTFVWIRSQSLPNGHPTCCDLFKGHWLAAGQEWLLDNPTWIYILIHSASLVVMASNLPPSSTSLSGQQADLPSTTNHTCFQASPWFSFGSHVFNFQAWLIEVPLTNERENYQAWIQNIYE